MNPSWWLPLGFLCSLIYLFYMLTIEFRLARLDDAVAAPETDVHNDLLIWSSEHYLPRVKTRKFRAFLRWVGVSLGLLLICWLFAGGGQTAVKALALATPTLTPTLTATATPSPTPSLTPTVGPSATPSHTPSPTGAPTQKIFQPAQVQPTQPPIVITKIVYQSVPVLRIVTTTPGPTQTPWIVTATSSGDLPTATATQPPTETPTLEPTATQPPTETPTPETNP